MRIATSTIYDNQTGSIDNLETEYQTLGNQLSSGISFNAPSDDPTIVSEDLGLRTTLATEAQQTADISSASNQLTSTDSALASLTSVLQSARSLAVQAASGTNSSTDLKAIGSQVSQLLQQAIGIANTQYNGTYIFAGSTNSTTPPVTANGSPITGVTIDGNDAAEGQLLDNGQKITTSTSLQAAFNVGAADGSPDVFTVLLNLENALNNGTVTDESGTALNIPGQVIQGSGSTTPSTLGDAPLATPLTADNSTIGTTEPAGSTKNYTIDIDSTNAAGVQSVETYTFTDQTAIDDGTPASVVGQINANTATTGISASFNVKTQRLTISAADGGTFYVSDQPTPSPPAATAATTTGNFVEAFGLQGQADMPNTLSTQLTDIDNALNVTLNSRAVVGATINTLSAVQSQVTTQSTDNTAVKSGLEDVNVAAATSQFTETETALQAAFETTTRLEGKTLFDYIS
jgi:flagellar hook-associated protein 3 FlgL